MGRSQVGIHKCSRMCNIKFIINRHRRKYLHIWGRPINRFVLGLIRKANDTGGGKIVLGSSTRQTSCDLGARGSACMVYRCGIKIKNSGTHIWLEPLRASLDGGIGQGCAQVWQLSGEVAQAQWPHPVLMRRSHWSLGNLTEPVAAHPQYST